VVGCLQRGVGFDGWCFAQTDPETLLPARGAAGNSPAVGRQQRFWQLEYQALDVNELASLAFGDEPARALSMSTGGDLARSRRWDEIMRPAGAGDELRAALVIGGYCWGSLSLYRASADRRYSGDDVRYVAQVLRPAAAGVRGTWAAGLPGCSHPEEGPGTVVVSADGTLLTATRQARRWLARLDHAPQGSHWQTILYAVTARVASRASAGAAEPAASVRTRTGDGCWLDVHASPLDRAVPGCDIAVTLQAAAPSRISPLLMAAHALSARERQIARLLLDGRSSAEIARTLHISLNTAKDHSKAIFRKTGTHSRSELTRCLNGQP
jgi:DNA-binding CsgD family transcriptional regulator